MGKLNGTQIKAWIKAGQRFEGRSDGDGLVLCLRADYRVPLWKHGRFAEIRQNPLPFPKLSSFPRWMRRRPGEPCRLRRDRVRNRALPNLVPE